MPDGPSPYQVTTPPTRSVPVVVSSPHSGRYYPRWFVNECRVGEAVLRKSEDAFVEQLAAGATDAGAPLIEALWPRTFIDVNREPLELDPGMYADALPVYVNARSTRVRSGLGTIPRLAANGAEIYRGSITYASARRRIREIYFPYHKALRSLMRQTREAFGHALLIDCHSMPSQTGAAYSLAAAPRIAQLGADIVLGDCHGTTCNAAVTSEAERIFKNRGLKVVRNTPYAGGFTTKHYGKLNSGFEAIQIEINRALYMNERLFEPTDGFAVIKEAMTDLFMALGTTKSLAQAAE